MDKSAYREGQWRRAESAPYDDDLLVAIVWTRGKATVVIGTRLDERNWTESYSDDSNEFTTDQVLGWMPMPEPPSEKIK